ncbi:long-chain-fatty-acid--CoA ligase 6 isoform X6 [Trachemys scripta elegans]|uniref:long-chain-fatty-acid--CoA ligase 6 isoform X6 n=1 Tax=Trachemys scripta elegans TaxID=31138 RepID=UPI001551C9B4|nr:long-chain-fatty-acid--CoA ligase 6 isoform X6 [Trachemys scripta elegans]
MCCSHPTPSLFRLPMLQPDPAGMLTFFLVSGGSIWLFMEFALSIFEKMQAQEILRSLRLPEFDDFSQFFHSLPATTLVGIGAFAAVIAYWFASRPKALKPPCDLLMQSEEVEGCEGARRSVIGDSTELLTHYYDDARTMYEVFRRGFNISADISTVICDKPEKARILLDHVEKRETPGLKSIILMDPFEKDLKERGKSCGVHVQSMQEVEACGRESQHVPVPPRPEDLSIVCFTSGTTGNPKGAMLTHRNVVADFSGFLKVTEKVIFPRQDDVLISFLPLAHMFERVIQVRNLSELTRPCGAPCVFFQSQWAPTCEDVHISYLPLAHMFERMVQSVVYCHGGRIGFFQGDIRLLSDDMKALRPTIFPVVPRLLNRMYDKIFSQADTPLKRWLLEFAAKRKKAEVQSGIIRNDSLWDKLFFNKIQASLGGCVRMIVTGAAPASPTVLGFLRAALGCQVYEGYGQTECTAGCTFTTPGDWTSGHVGAPLPCNLIKLMDVEEMNYFSSKGEGEICVKGPNVFKGYLKDGEKTAEALDKEGWLHTGDIGKWLPTGTLKIIDRKKHIFKLAQGEYIAPEKIENIYIRSEPIAQIYVHGDSLQAFLVGIVVPDSEVMPGWARKRGFEGTYAELCKNTELTQAIMEDMVRLGKEGGLHSFEQVKTIYIHSDMFSIQNGLLTPTLKARRRELRDYFKKQIEELYSSVSI